MTIKATLRKMTKPQLVDYACDYFEDTGQLRQEMESLNKEDLYSLLIEHNADSPPEEEPPDVQPKAGPVSTSDLGNW